MALRKLLSWGILLLCPATAGCSEQAASVQVKRYSGMCDASAAVALDGRLFLAADDEKNTLQIYRADRPGRPVHSLPWDKHLGVDLRKDEHPEVDIEGATVLGDRIYWISSHGRNKNGKWRPNRHRFFAMTVKIDPKGVTAKPFGKPYERLAVDLAGDPRMQDLGLDDALGLGKNQVVELAPKKRGLNLEGLCATADGRSLLIAFRNPLSDKNAILVPLNNPVAIVKNGTAPEFGDPIQLKLKVKLKKKSVDLGIRGIEYSKRHGAYLIMAGLPIQRRAFALYQWSGRKDDKPQLLEKTTAIINDIKKFTPEALIVYPDKDKVQLLSDDGVIKVKVGSADECMEGAYEKGYCQAKFLLDDTKKTFKSLLIAVE